MLPGCGLCIVNVSSPLVKATRLPEDFPLLSNSNPNTENNRVNSSNVKSFGRLQKRSFNFPFVLIAHNLSSKDTIISIKIQINHTHSWREFSEALHSLSDFRIVSHLCLYCQRIVSKVNILLYKDILSDFTIKTYKHENKQKDNLRDSGSGYTRSTFRGNYLRKCQSYFCWFRHGRRLV